MTYGERRCLAKRSLWRDSRNELYLARLLLVCYLNRLVHLDDDTGRAVNICVHENVVLAHEALHQDLVLLGIAATDHQIPV